MAITVTEFKTRFREFRDSDEYSEDELQLYIDDAANYHMGTDENRWGDCYDIAQAYLAAHLLTMATATGAGDTGAKAGPISSKSAGGVSVQRAVIAKDQSAGTSMYSTTAYGQQFLYFRDVNFTGVLTVSGCG